MPKVWDLAKIHRAISAAIADGKRTREIVDDLTSGRLVAGQRPALRSAYRYVGQVREQLRREAAEPEEQSSTFLEELAAKEADSAPSDDGEGEAPDATSELVREPPRAPERAPSATVEPPPLSPRALLIERVIAPFRQHHGADYAERLRAWLASSGNRAGLIRALERLEAEHRDDAERLGAIREALRELRPPQPVRRARRDRLPPIQRRRDAGWNPYSWERMMGTVRLR